MRKIAIEFDGPVAEARALARGGAYVFEASRVGEGATYIEGFSMNPSDKWHAGDPKITIVEKQFVQASPDSRDLQLVLRLGRGPKRR